jgi:hypothetical protein
MQLLVACVSSVYSLLITAALWSGAPSVHRTEMSCMLLIPVLQHEYPLYVVDTCPGAALWSGSLPVHSAEINFHAV